MARAKMRTGSVMGSEVGMTLSGREHEESLNRPRTRDPGAGDPDGRTAAHTWAPMPADPG
jgi:hypothetical protein